MKIIGEETRQQETIDVDETAYRDPRDAQIAELQQQVDKLTAENEELVEEIETLEAEAASTTLKSIGRALAILGVIALVALLCVGLFRSRSYGEDARRIAEREAREHFRRSRSSAPYAVICVPVSGDQSCRVFATAGAEPVLLLCDDDPPRWNDGCVPYEAETRR